MIGRLIFWVIIIALIYFAYQHFSGGNSELATKIASLFHNSAANITK